MTRLTKANKKRRSKTPRKSARFGVRTRDHCNDAEVRRPRARLGVRTLDSFAHDVAQGVFLNANTSPADVGRGVGIQSGCCVCSFLGGCACDSIHVCPNKGDQGVLARACGSFDDQAGKSALGCGVSREKLSPRANDVSACGFGGGCEVSHCSQEGRGWGLRWGLSDDALEGNQCRGTAMYSDEKVPEGT